MNTLHAISQLHLLDQISKLAQRRSYQVSSWADVGIANLPIYYNVIVFNRAESRFAPS